MLSVGITDVFMLSLAFLLVMLSDVMLGVELMNVYILSVIMHNVILFNTLMLSVIVLSVIMLSVVMTNVVASLISFNQVINLNLQLFLTAAIFLAQLQFF